MSQDTPAPRVLKSQPVRWYVLYTASRAEKAVERRLTLMGAEVFLPLYREKRKWSDRVKTVEVPLYRSYVFIHCTRAQLSKFASVEGVACPVYYCGEPAVIRDSEIEEIHKFLIVVDQSRIISEGDRHQDRQPLHLPHPRIYRQPHRLRRAAHRQGDGREIT